MFTGVDVDVNVVADPEPNILIKNYTSNGNDTGTGVFTGYDITINLPNKIMISAIKYNGNVILTSDMTYVSSSTNVTFNSECMWMLTKVSTSKFSM